MQASQEDERFAFIHRDPRFKRPKKKDLRVVLDDRFQHMLNSEDFNAASTQLVDKYGRPVKQRMASYSNLEKFYDFKPTEDEGDDGSKEGKAGASNFADYARGDVLMSSSSDDDDQRDDTEGELSSDDNTAQYEDFYGVSDSENEEGVVRLGHAKSTEDTELPVESLLQTQDVPECQPTRRLALVNMDWDYVSALTLLHVLHAFKPQDGVILKVAVYPSEFGKERMAIEERQGPAMAPPFQSDRDPCADAEKDEYEDEDERDLLQQNDSDDKDGLDQVALRRYQLERLRYYYAVVECDSVQTAQSLYNQCDGTEFEHSSVLMDLRYIPDDVDFSQDVARDEATELISGFQPRDFISTALQHSSVKLTWDADDPDRKQVMQRKFTKQDLKSMDFKAYLASSDEDSETDEQRKSLYQSLISDRDPSGPAASDNEESKEEEMEITFAPGLSEKAEKLLQAKRKRQVNESETVFEKYLREKREKKSKRKRDRLAEQGNGDDSDLFLDAETKPSLTAHSKPKKYDRKDADNEEAKDHANLELLLMDEAAIEDFKEGKHHFDMDRIEQRQKAAKRPKKKSAVKEKSDPATQEEDGFQIDLQDDRFSALFTTPSFSLDPTSSKFRQTQAMQDILAERRRRLQSSSLALTDSKLDGKAELSMLVNKIRSREVKFINRVK